MKAFRNPLVVYGSFAALCAVVVVGSMLASPSEPGNTVFWGLSLPRLALALGLLNAAIIFIAITIRAATNQEWAERFLDGCGLAENVSAKPKADLDEFSFGLDGTLSSFHAILLASLRIIDCGIHYGFFVQCGRVNLES